LKTSQEWWDDTKSNPQAIASWLQRQLAGELSAVALISSAMLKFVHQLTAEQTKVLTRIVTDEIKHANWIRELLEDRGIPPAEHNAHDRYWLEILNQAQCLNDLFQAGAQAEAMRLQRIEAIADTDEGLAEQLDIEDIVDVFYRIWRDEEFHAKAFKRLQGQYNNEAVKNAHEQGLVSLELILN
jgi:rubrerythrin